MSDTLALATAELAPILGQPADQNPALVYLGSVAPGGRRALREGLRRMAWLLTGGARTAKRVWRPGRCDFDTLPWAALRFQHTAAIRAALAELYAPATANQLLAALRGVLKAAWQLGQMTADAYQVAVNVRSVPGGNADPAGRALTREEVAALLGACAADPSPAGARDGAVIAVMYACGPRRAEVAGLALGDLVTDGGGAWLVIRHGKGNKARRIPVAALADGALADWLALRGRAPGPLFVPIGKAGALAMGRPMTAQAVCNALTKRRVAAGVAPFAPHDLRRTFISELLDRGADIVTVQKLAGHANVTTTARYDRRGDRAKRAAVDLLSLPSYPRRIVAPEA